MTTYREFLEGKSQVAGKSGFEPLFLPDYLKPFQRFLVEWSVRQGRALLIESCGLGKTVQQLTWADNVFRKTDRPVLVVAPLAVGAQTVREADKFGIDAKQSRDGTIHPRITVTNYERLHYFDPDDFAGVVCDEAQALKAFDGKRRKQVVRFLSKVQYRLLCTATPAPNDFIELGTLSEALGVMTQSDMLAMFFKSSDNMRHNLFKEGDYWNRPKWFFKPHSEVPFWKWVCSWARAVRTPEDVGFDGTEFILPPLTMTQHVVGGGFHSFR